MAKFWKWATRQRRYWPPDASFVVVIILSILLGVWPLADPQWTKKGAYLLVVIAMLIVASLVSARDRWRLERRYAGEFGAHLLGVKSRLWALEYNLTLMIQRYYRAAISGVTMPVVDDEYFGCFAELTGVLSELVHLQIFVPNVLQTAMDREPKTIDDINLIIDELAKMNSQLHQLYIKTLLGN
ncbi:MAG TPA: hypothetical protein VFE35_11675 [Candidatus Cybelea sp.]|jgi:hypothetical protein|nr:hypothetical protein [Candidatus Cybelea sp.]